MIWASVLQTEARDSQRSGHALASAVEESATYTLPTFANTSLIESPVTENGRLPTKTCQGRVRASISGCTVRQWIQCGVEWSTECMQHRETVHSRHTGASGHLDGTRDAHGASALTGRSLIALLGVLTAPVVQF